MIELNRLNPVPGVATNAMVLFLAINTSNIALFPTGVIALRATLGSTNAAAIWLPTLIVTSLSTLVGIAVTKLLERVAPPITAYPPGEVVAEKSVDLPDASETGVERPTWRAGCAIALAILAAIALGLVRHLSQAFEGGGSAGEVLGAAASNWLLPVLIVAMLGYGLAKRVPLYDAMIGGAREGFQVAVRIIPFLVAIIVAAGMFRASGALDAVVRTIGPATSAVGFPAEALPVAILRPLSGTGSYAVMAETLKAEGPDSHVGYLVSTLQGSTETTFYVLAVYFGSVGIKNTRHAIACGLTAELAGFLGAVAVCYLFFG
jgi:spore maturation protein SpmB